MGRSKRSGVVDKSGAASSLATVGAAPPPSMAAPKPAATSAPSGVVPTSNRTWPSITSVRLLRLADSSNPTRYCVPRTPTTAVGVLTSSGLARRTWVANTSTDPRSSRSAPENRPVDGLLALSAELVWRRLATTSARLDGASLMRDWSASSSTADPSGPVSMVWPSFSAAGAVPARPSTRTSPVTLVKLDSASLQRSRRTGT